MKVFGIGYQRTGVTSLANALNLLGIRTLQFPTNLYTNLEHRSIRRFDGFTDNPLPLIYKKLDQRHPGAKFIHTVRDEEAWLKSIRWLFSTGAIKFKLAFDAYGHRFHQDLYGTVEFNEAIFLEKYRAYNEDVIEYFKDRPNDYLMMDYGRGDGFNVLCPFLGLPIPDQPYPHSNKSESLIRWKLRSWFRRKKNVLFGNVR